MLAVTILGSGTSHGVPMVGCHCPVCTSGDPHDQRTRPSILIDVDGHKVLVDTAPELRLQMVAAGIDLAEAVLLTHGHADHLHGIDDVRRFNEQLGRPIPVYGTPALLADVQARFPYIFAHSQSGGGIPSLELRPIEGPFELFGRMFTPVPVWHGETPVTAFRVGDFAYVTDTNGIPESSRALLQNLDTLVLDALRHEPHPTHFNFQQATEMVKLLGPKRAFFTHLTHSISHAAVGRELPEGIALAYDGLRLEVP
jgi:phosphoribosyl 1,2-cyclic phosphate phosphodiesterase